MTSGDLCSPQDTEGQVQGAPNLKSLLCTLRNEDLPRAPVRTQDDFLPSNRRAIPSNGGCYSGPGCSLGIYNS